MMRFHNAESENADTAHALGLTCARPFCAACIAVCTACQYGEECSSHLPDIRTYTCTGVDTCPWRLGDTCPHNPAFDLPACDTCGEPIDHCQGHGEIG